MNQVIDKIIQYGIVPVIVLENTEDALPLADSLCTGGLPCAEITFRTAAAEDSIRIMTQKYPDMLVGAGTVLSVEQVEKAVNAGAGFIVSPGLNPKVVQYCQKKNIPVIPGVATPSEIEQALELGITNVKFFPAEALGGIKMLKALAAPYVGVQFMPTGGINAQNLRDYLAYDRVNACGGSWMVKSNLIKAGEFDKITEMVSEAVGIVKEIRG